MANHWFAHGELVVAVRQLVVAPGRLLVVDDQLVVAHRHLLTALRQLLVALDQLAIGARQLGAARRHFVEADDQPVEAESQFVAISGLLPVAAGYFAGKKVRMPAVDGHFAVFYRGSILPFGVLRECRSAPSLDSSPQRGRENSDWIPACAGMTA